MHRLATLALSAAALVALGAAPSVAAPVAPVETCEGRPATVTGSGTVVGTEGPDVIVARNASVQALGGDDVICVRASDVVAGAGDDRVTTLGRGISTADLGPGNDRFTGGEGDDVLTAPGSSEGADVVATGGGRDLVTAGPGDQVDTGSGRDQVTVETGATPATVAGGSGRDFLWLIGTGGGSWAVDLGGAALRDGTVLASYSGFEEHFVDLRDGASASLTGTPGRDTVTFQGGALDAALGAGDDRLAVYRYQGNAGAGVLDGGSGRDLLAPVTDGRFTADLERGTLRVRDAAGLRSPFAVPRWEGVLGTAQSAAVRGSDGPDTVKVSACRLRASGRDGADRLQLLGGGGSLLDCGRRTAVLTGQRGDDRLVGGTGADRLVGGSGSDLADGRGGTDTCRAERRVSCER